MAARYLIEEFGHGIAKFAQSLRVKKDAEARISPRVLKRLILYLHKHHVGFRNDTTDEDEDEIE